MTFLVLVTLFLPYVKADVQLSQEFVDPVKNRSFEEIGSSVCECPPWLTNNGGWRELRSDVNENGEVDIFDLKKVNLVIGGWITDPYWVRRCDVNGDGSVDVLDLKIVKIDMGKKMGVDAFCLEGDHSWYTSGGGDYEMWQWLDSDAVQAVAGETVVFSFWFYPRSVASDGSQNNARAEIYYEYSGGSKTVYGIWIAPPELKWWNPYVIANLPSTTTAVKIVIHGKPNFKAWVDLTQLTTVTITPPDTSTANPYSTDYEFDVPIDGQNQVTYHHEVQVYIWSEWDNQYFAFKATQVDDWVLNVKMDGTLRHSGSTSDPPCQPVSVDLGPLSMGYHTLEFDFVEQSLAGKVKFYVALFGDPNLGKAALTQFHVDVPDYGDSDVRYKVKTTTHFPIHDHYFLIGYADDYIDDLYVNGLKWQDWEWDMGEYGAIYAWGDGFCYPLGQYKGWYGVQFDFGEIWGGGSLHFEYISWTNQRDKIGPPRFRAVGNLYEADYITINSAMFYGGSKWKFEDDPQFSERYFEARQVINANYDHAGTWFDAGLEVGLGLGWAEWALLPATEDDVGITLNLSCRHFDSNKGMEPPYWWRLGLDITTIDIYSFPALEIEGIEYQEHDSFVLPDLTSAIDYTGTVVMFVSTALLGPTPQGILGASVGLGIKGIAAVIKITEGQHVSDSEVKLSELHHYQLEPNYGLGVVATAPEGSQNRYDSDIYFFKLNPSAGKHCGLTKIVIKGKIRAELILGTTLVEFGSIGDIDMSISIPWFLRG